MRIEGADSATLDGRLLHIATAAGEIALPLPAAGFSLTVEVIAGDASLLRFVAAPGAGEIGLASAATFRAPADNPANLLYSTFLGSGNQDYGEAVAVDGAGGALDYATFLGGRDYDYGHAIAVDGAGSAYLTGETQSSNFPTTPGAFDTSFNDDDAFVVRLNPAGSALGYATFLGGSRSDYGYAITLDGAGRTHVAGLTRSINFPTTPGAFDRSFNGGYTDVDAFVAMLNPAGSALGYATFLGGSDPDDGAAIAVDGAGRAYLTGWTHSSNFPTTPDAFDTSKNGVESDAFVAKLAMSTAPPPTPTPTRTPTRTPTPTPTATPPRPVGQLGP